MPKISSNSIQIKTDHIDKFYDFDVLYNKKNLFYINIPAEFKNTLDHLSIDSMKKISIKRVYKNETDRILNPANYTCIVSAGSELEVKELYREALKVLLSKSIKQRNVIIVFFQGDRDNTRYNRHEYNEEHHLIYTSLALTYAVETSIDDHKVYSIYSEYNAFGETRINRKQISLYTPNSTVIEDTPENRKSLELIYEALKNLNEKLKSFITTPETLIEFIASKNNLLNN